MTTFPEGILTDHTSILEVRGVDTNPMAQPI